MYSVYNITEDRILLKALLGEVSGVALYISTDELFPDYIKRAFIYRHQIQIEGPLISIVKGDAPTTALSAISSKYTNLFSQQ